MKCERWTKRPQSEGEAGQIRRDDLIPARAKYMAIVMSLQNKSLAEHLQFYVKSPDFLAPIDD